MFKTKSTYRSELAYLKLVVHKKVRNELRSFLSVFGLEMLLCVRKCKKYLPTTRDRIIVKICGVELCPDFFQMPVIEHVRRSLHGVYVPDHG